VRTPFHTPQTFQMAKAAPSKKTAKAAKTASTGGKKKAHRKGKETFNSYIHKVLKQVHPGAFPAPPRPRARPQSAPRGAPPPVTPRPMSELEGVMGEGARCGPRRPSAARFGERPFSTPRLPAPL